jgi:hypothetical protein
MTIQAPGTNPVTRVLPRLVDHVKAWFTSLAEFHSATRVRAAWSPNRCITFPRASPLGFQAAECRSSALPLGRVRSLFGTVSHASHQQALAGLSPLNFSRPKVFPSVPGLVMARSVCLATAELPALAHVERTAASCDVVARTPWVDLATRLRLACTIVVRHGGRTGHTSHARAGQARRVRLHAASPTSSSTATRHFTARSVSVVPPPMRGINHEIE